MHETRLPDWYSYCHHGSLASLEDLFTEDRFEDTYRNVRGIGPIVGHRYGLGLEAEERGALVAYLRTL